ncbi:HI1506-related protein [Vibrio parahaemolyticus]|uniref:HI1506-related protein n=1 Tax=Vibrio parahaemolyticus TaxID=670 RepID=UPI0038922025
MSQKVLDLLVKNFAHTGYRRAGVAFKKGDNRLCSVDFTDSQLAMLDKDPRLSVQKLAATSDTHADVNLQAGPLVGSIPSVSVDSQETGSSKQALDIDAAAQLAVQGAMFQLESDNPAHWTKGGKPEINALSAILERKVTAAERDDAWNVLNSEEYQGDKPPQPTLTDTDNEE